MPTLDLIVTYYRYQQWSNQRVLDTAARLPFGQLTQPVLTGSDPVRTALVHTMWAQQFWLHRFQGRPRVTAFRPDHFPDLDSVRTRWQEIDDATFDYLETLTEERLTSPDEPAAPLWQALLHQANHQSLHRGEIAAVLTHLGASPGDLDLFRMFDNQR